MNKYDQKWKKYTVTVYYMKKVDEEICKDLCHYY